MAKQIRKKLNIAELELVTQYDRIMREHNWIAMSAGNELNRTKMEIAKKIDPDLQLKWERGFVDIGIDWKTGELVVSPTTDANKKAEEVEFALQMNKKKSVN